MRPVLLLRTNDVEPCNRSRLCILAIAIQALHFTAKGLQITGLGVAGDRNNQPRHHAANQRAAEHVSINRAPKDTKDNGSNQINLSGQC